MPAEAGVGADRQLFADLAADLIGAEIGRGRSADLDRAVAAAAGAAGDGAAGDGAGRSPVDPSQLAARLRRAPAGDPARRAFVEALTISETQLFRIQPQFDALADRVLPGLLAARAAPGARLRLWSAGCSTGEEAWSLAIVLERLLPAGRDATVVATDVDETALERAERGVYGPHSFRGVPEWVRARWFTPAGPDRWEVDQRLRRRVHFALLNLVAGGYPSPANGTAAVDVLLCRNVLMYLTAEARQRVAGRLARCLAPGGWLAVAPAEVAAADFPGLAVRHFPLAILHQRPDPAGPAAP
ncbi:MAG TPA: protein-glutamate O-methyltransferase CheR [Acidimicrobiia bacterium]|nr:protein-glutamate O-methyltransferase CheR [Acidimicrobiia bacterium]